MDISKLIRKQIEEINAEGHSPYLDLILNHLERAEVYYQNGQNDSHFYNDVIYRTNQAFEGALKESFKVLGDKTDAQISRTTPNNIEKYLKEENIFKDRVLRLFENYRQEWRNKSTHDYKLILDENEAFLALVNVSSFVHLLLKQIQEKNAFNREMNKQVTTTELLESKNIINNSSYTLANKVLKLIAKFIVDLPQGNEFKNEEEINGKLYAFLLKHAKDLGIKREPNFKVGKIAVRPDFLVKHYNDQLIIEVKRQYNSERIKSHINQLASYMTAAAARNAILFFGKGTIEDDVLQVEVHDVPSKEGRLRVYVVL